MLDHMKEVLLKLSTDSAMLQVVITLVICLNVLLAAVKTVLEKVKDMTKTDADNKAYAVVAKVAAMLSKVVDWVSANIEHKK